MRLFLDVMLGKLATYLRMCGHDAAYALDRGVEADDAVLALARREDRTLLTRDRTLADRYDDSILLTTRSVEGQLRELRDAGVDISLSAEPSRCGRCNASLEVVTPGTSTPDYAPPSASEAVWRCPECGQHFWRGSHWADVRDRLDAL